MKELIRSHWSRILVYFTISAQSVMLIFGSFHVGILESRVHTNEKNIALLKEENIALQKRMVQREIVAAKYVPMLEGLKKLGDTHQDLLERIMNRQAYMNKLIEKPLEKKK